VSSIKLKESLVDEYGLTGLEVDDVMRYMKALCTEFESLGRSFKTEHLIELTEHTTKARQNKSEKNMLFKTAKFATNRLSGSAKDLRKQYLKTKKARHYLTTSIDTHKMGHDHKNIITKILQMMADNGQLYDADRAVTGRRAYESLSETSIEV